MNAIEHICEPDHLVLTWQSPDLHGSERKRFGVADLHRVADDAILIYRDNREVSDAVALGYSGYPAFRMDNREHPHALAAFKRRLPPRERSDFFDYLRNFRIHTCQLSDFALLGYTEAKLPSDGFGIVNQLQEDCTPSEYMLEIAGFRHYLEDSIGLTIGQELSIEFEPDNPYDSSAIAFHWNGQKIGNVNRFQIETISTWLRGGHLRASFERRNGSPTRPRGYAFLRIR